MVNRDGARRGWNQSSVVPLPARRNLERNIRHNVPIFSGFVGVPIDPGRQSVRLQRENYVGVEWRSRDRCQGGGEGDGSGQSAFGSGRRAFDSILTLGS